MNLNKIYNRIITNNVSVNDFEDIVHIFREVQEVLLGVNVIFCEKSRDEKILVFGDMHGNIDVLSSIFKWSDDAENYFFLGDFIDKGKNSIEVLVCLAIKKLLYPDNVFLIIGNHEYKFFTQYTKHNSVLKREIKSRGFTDHQVSKIITPIVKFLKLLPTVILLNHKYLMVHGGIQRNKGVKHLTNLLIRKKTKPTLFLRLSDKNQEEERKKFGPSTSKNVLGERLILLRGHDNKPEYKKYGYNVHDSHLKRVITVYTSTKKWGCYCLIYNNVIRIMSLASGKELDRVLGFPPEQITTSHKFVGSYSPKKGDMVLFEGDEEHKESKLIKIVTSSNITHVAIIDVIDGEPWINEATVQLPGDTHVDYLLKRPKRDGIMLIRYHDRLRTYKGKIFIRPLNKPYSGEGFMKIYKRYYNREFETSMLEMLNSVLRIGKIYGKPSLDKFFCSEYIAQMFKDIGWLDKKPASKFYTPRDFLTLQIKSKEYKYSNSIIQVKK